MIVGRGDDPPLPLDLNVELGDKARGNDLRRIASELDAFFFNGGGGMSEGW
jgi:hypothetical protein